MLVRCLIPHVPGSGEVPCSEEFEMAGALARGTPEAQCYPVPLERQEMEVARRLISTLSAAARSSHQERSTCPDTLREGGHPDHPGAVAHGALGQGAGPETVEMAAVSVAVVRPPDIAVSRDVDADRHLPGLHLPRRAVEDGPLFLRRQGPALAGLGGVVESGHVRHAGWRCLERGSGTRNSCAGSPFHVICAAR